MDLKININRVLYQVNLWNIHEISDMLKLNIYGVSDLGVGVSRGLGIESKQGDRKSLHIDTLFGIT